MNEQQRKLYEKYVMKTSRQHLLFQNEDKSEGYGLGWKHAIEYVNELIQLHQLEQFRNMSDDEFNEFMRKQME